jgi:putative transcriptional regulator
MLIYGTISSIVEVIAMYVAIDDRLKELDKTRYWLAKTIKCNYQSMAKLCNNETNGITFDLLERLLYALDCTPNDIFKE